MDPKLEDKIRQKWKDAGYDYDLAKLEFALELEKQKIKNGNKS
jgi:hypothetical protein